MNFLSGVLSIVPPLIGIGKAIFGGNRNNNTDYQQYESLKRELSRQIEDLKNEKRRMEQINQESINKITDLEQQLKNHLKDI